MNIYRLEGKNDIPEIILDHTTGKLHFSGKSLPEDVKEVYNPVIEWIASYCEMPNEKTQAVFKFEYFNTATSKKLLDILEILTRIKDKGLDLQVDWYFNEGDEDMKEAGEHFSEFVKTEFNMISY